MSLVTDSTPLEDPKSMKDTALGNLFALFASQQEYQDLEKRLHAGGLGWGHAKEELFQAINSEVKSLRERYEEIRPDENFLKKVLSDGAEKAREISEPILARVKNAIGFDQY